MWEAAVGVYGPKDVGQQGMRLDREARQRRRRAWWGRVKRRAPTRKALGEGAFWLAVSALGVAVGVTIGQAPSLKTSPADIRHNLEMIRALNQDIRPAPIELDWEAVLRSQQAGSEILHQMAVMESRQRPLVEDDGGVDVVPACMMGSAASK